MKKINNLPLFAWVIISLFFISVQPLFSQEFSELITEEYLQTEFVFKEGEKLKYSKCKKKSYPTCTYVWGVKSKRDVTRAKHGLAPEGNKLMLIYAQASGSKDFERVIAIYPDAKEIDGIGTKSVWSSKRKQLSFITDKNLVVHINLDLEENAKAEDHAISIAKYLVDKL